MFLVLASVNAASASLFHATGIVSFPPVTNVMLRRDVFATVRGGARRLRPSSSLRSEIARADDRTRVARGIRDAHVLLVRRGAHGGGRTP